ncbi:MAG: hypothetical protein Q8L48_39290 [Archangium sp.]|nr:hypothetical protein [Archangium sp.]
MLRSLSVACAVVACAGCVTTPPPPKMSASEAFAPATVQPVDAAQARAALGSPKDWARQFRRDIDCERNANELKVHNGREVAWTYVVACISKGGFTQLESLVDHWDEELRARPEAPALIAQILASRGGHLRVDLEILQQKRIPVFDLASALKQSGAFKGRYLVFVAKISEAKEKKGKTELVLLEQALSSEAAMVLSNGQGSGSVSSSSGAGTAAWRSNGVLGSGSASGSYSQGGSSVSGQFEQRVTDTFEETGQEIIAKVKQPDPFLTVDKNLVFLVRFDGSARLDTASASEGVEDPLRTALVTLISYHDL